MRQPNQTQISKGSGLTWRQFYALIWKDFVVHKRHYIWTMLEITIPVLVCAMAILSNSHQGKAKLENERAFDPDDFERLYGDLDPQRHRLLVAPNSSFTRALIEQIDDGAVTIELCNTEEELVELIRKEIPVALDQVKKLLPDDSSNVTIGGVVIKSDAQLVQLLEKKQNIQWVDSKKIHSEVHDKRPHPKHKSMTKNSYFEVISKLDGQKMKIPVNLEMSIRSKDFRLGKEPFPKKYSLSPFSHSDHYQATFFMASQIMLSRAYINLVANYINSTSTRLADIVIPSNNDIIGQRMPYPKYVAHKRLKDSTLGTFVAGSQKQKPFVLTMDYCITVGFLVTAIFLAKRVVDEKKSRVRDMLRLVGISDWTYYGSHMTNTMIIMVIQCAMITMIFTGHIDAPAQNIDSTLLFTILVIYCSASVMFVLALSTMFNSSMKAIIFTSLLWLGLPEVIDRIFKLNAGVIESNGFFAVAEPYHVLFCLIPNFGLRLVNRLLTECDIYGEFFDKKQLYGEYRAIWPNITNHLPLYRFITVAHLMAAMLISIPVYICLIYLIDLMSSSQATGLASLSGEGNLSSKGFSLGPVLLLVKTLLKILCTILKAPFKFFKYLVMGSSYSDSNQELDCARSNLNQSTPVVSFSHSNHKQVSGQLNAAYATSYDNLTCNQPKDGKLTPNMELSNIDSTNGNTGILLDCPSLASKVKCTASQTIDKSGCDSELKYFEPAPGMLKRGVSIRNLSKTYYTSNAKLKQIDAVKNVSLDMFYSQILVLLGHNGAGKTTLIDIISGHNQKSGGTIIIDNFNIDTHPNEARQSVGFCPQFDVLFDRLTVEEHLYFYGIVKGARKGLQREIDDLLVQSGLDVHQKKLSKALSGGYKRKLSLAIAMIAESKILILDEPTSGMDPESRRKVWDFLQLIRHDRLILMTTHHMEEADALGDRIAVMSSGQVKCCGSALFLKKVFNAGYHLRISKSADWNQIAFDELIGAKYRLQEKLENVTPHELMYKFDVDETTEVLPPLFDDLERVKERVGIFGFGMTVSTMDDVFMKIGIHFKDVEAQEMQSKFEMANGIGEPKHNGSIDNKQVQNSISKLYAPATKPYQIKDIPKERVEGNKLFKQHVRALVAKRYHHARKNWFQLLWIWGISLACIAGIVILIDFVIFKEEITPEWSKEMTLEGAGYGTETTGIWQFAPPMNPVSDIEALRDSAFPVAPTSGPDGNNISNPMKPEASTTATNTPTMVSGVVVNRGENREVTTTTTVAPTTVTRIASSSTTAIDRRRRRRRTKRQTSDGNNLIEGDSTKSNDSALFLNRYWLNEAKSSGMRDLISYTDVNTQMIDLLTRQFADFRERYVVGGEKAGNKYVAWYNGEASHSFPVSMNIMLNSILKQFTDLIQEKEHPLKGSRISLIHDAMAHIDTKIAFLPYAGRILNLVFLPFSLAFITSYFVIFPTHERVTKSKHLQLMAGVPARTFWLSHFLFDLLLYFLYTTSVLAVYYVWDQTNDRKIYFENFEHSAALIALVSLFIFGALPLAYIFSFLAKKPTSAFSSFCLLTILTGTATLTLVSLYELKYEQNASTTFALAFSAFLWSARLIPSVSLLIGLQKLFALNTTRSICINISPEVLELLCRYINSPLVDDELRLLRPERCCKQVCENECFDQNPFFWSSWFGINIELAMLVFDALLLWTILTIIESRSLRARLWMLVESYSPVRLWKCFVAKARSYCWQVPQFSDNKDVQNEQLKIDQIIQTKSMDDYSMVVNNLTKVYSTNNFKAVDQLSFVVDKREFFGLLGVNGAGKSTTFKMLTGELRPTSGNSWIGSHDLNVDRRQYLKKIGYCPQQDALIDSMTGVEMLTLFARLRGLPERYIQDSVVETLDKLGLTRIGHVDCNNYSGGNKRRLSVGMALIGAPDVIFLDEPTSGVDPRSRRRLWSTLIEFQQQTQSAIVMTSHSMNECECLCDRVAIMVGGQFKVLGSVQYLRTKLSQGFSLVLKLKPDNLNQLQDLKKSSERINEYMKKAFSAFRIELRDLHQTIIQYHIQPSAELTWSKMLLALEKAKQELDLEDYQITSDASLESIFLSLAKQQQAFKQCRQEVKVDSLCHEWLAPPKD